MVKDYQYVKRDGVVRKVLCGEWLMNRGYNANAGGINKPIH
jgi:hypothetical protein